MKKELIGFWVLFTGLVLLGNTTGFVSWSIWQTITQFWPLVIIVLGIQMLHLEQKAKRLVILLLAILVFLMILAGTGKTRPAINNTEDQNPESYLVIPT